MSVSRVSIVENILGANEAVAASNRALLDSHGVFALNMMASPGAGKTSVILQTLKQLGKEFRIGVVEGDTAPVTIDSDRVMEAGAAAVQINTGGECHLDAVMLSGGLNKLPLDQLDLVIIENVGNLICPASFPLGAHASVLIASTPEGDDKPYKYPNMYRGVDVLIINKIDLLPYLNFNMDYFRRGVEMLNPNLVTFPLSSVTGEGVSQWCDWLRAKIKSAQK